MNEGNANIQRRVKIIAWLLVTAALFFTIGWQLGSQGFAPGKGSYFNQTVGIANGDKPQNVTVDFAPFWDVWEIVTTRYLDRSNLDPQKLLWGAISGMVKAVGDPYTAFLTPEENKAVKEELEGTYSGVGIQLGFKDKKLVVIAPLSKTPAEEAGIRPGDRILKIDDTETDDLSLPEAARRIRGEVGTKVRLTLLREGEDKPFEQELIRKTIQVKSVEIKISESPKGKIAVIKLSRFGEKTNEEWDSAVSEALAANVKGVILDVRNNPGGFLNGAVYIGSEFLTGKIVGQEGADGKAQFLTATRAGKLLTKPLVVLINKGSASAAEIVAGAVQERSRGKLVGETSFGKGTVQDTKDLEGGSGVHFTVAQWLLPSGKGVNGQGLKPDFEVQPTEADITQNRDVQLEKALEVLKAKL